jgi:hypothetical protein
VSVMNAGIQQCEMRKMAETARVRAVEEEE